MTKSFIRIIYLMLKKLFGPFRLEEKNIFQPLQYYFLKKIRADRVKVNGYDLFLDENDSLKLSIHGMYEPAETELIKENVKEGDIVVDIGANIGYYTLLFSQLVGTKGKVYAFEPDPKNFELLKKNVEINGFKNVILENKAIGEKNEEMKLYLSTINMGAHSIHKGLAGNQFEVIKVVKLDDYFSKKEKSIDFMKMDIQGSEILALKGMKDLVNASKNLTLITEYWPFGLEKNGLKPISYIKMLVSYGFKIFDLQKGKETLASVTVKDLEKMYSPSEITHTDLLCVRKS